MCVLGLLFFAGAQWISQIAVGAPDTTFQSILSLGHGHPRQRRTRTECFQSFIILWSDSQVAPYHCYQGVLQISIIITKPSYVRSIPYWWTASLFKFPGLLHRKICLHSKKMTFSQQKGHFKFSLLRFDFTILYCFLFKTPNCFLFLIRIKSYTNAHYI